MTENARVTSNPDVVADWLQRPKGVAILPFGGVDYRLYGIFSRVTQEEMAEIARVKGREEGKPFVQTTDAQHVSSILEAQGISKNVLPATLDKVGKILQQGSERSPIGVLLERDEEADIPSWVQGAIKIGEERIPTVGFMVSGPDQDYREIVSKFDKDRHFLTGTSANLSGDPMSRGSGHHNMVGVVRDFGDKNVCIYVPESSQDGRGPSTTIFHLKSNGEQAYVVREGSLPSDRLASILFEAGVQEMVKRKDFTKASSSYDYSDENTNGLADFYNLMWTNSRQSDFNIPSFWIENLRYSKLLTKRDKVSA